MMQLAAGAEAGLVEAGARPQDAQDPTIGQFAAAVEGLREPTTVTTPVVQPVTEVPVSRVPQGTELGDRVLGQLEALHERGSAMAAKSHPNSTTSVMDLPRFVAAGTLPGPAQAFPTQSSVTPPAGEQAAKLFEDSKASLLEAFHHAQTTNVVMRAVAAIPGSANKLLSG